MHFLSVQSLVSVSTLITVALAHHTHSAIKGNDTTHISPTGGKHHRGGNSTSYTWSTIFATSTYTILSCAPTITNCPVGKVTETVYATTTYCPVAGETGTASSSESVTIVTVVISKPVATICVETSGTVSGSVYTQSTSSRTSSGSGTASFSSASTSGSLLPSSSKSATVSYSQTHSGTVSSVISSLSSSVPYQNSSSKSSSSSFSTTSLSSSSKSLSSAVTSKSSSKTSSSSTSSSASSSSSSSTTSTSKSSSSSSITSTSKSSSSSISTSSLSSTSSFTTSTSTSSSTSSSATPTQTGCYYWMENIKKQGIAPFNAASGTYEVFRNVKDFGAKGDGITDDTAAINLAISNNARCAPGLGAGSCQSSSTTPAVVYFPSGTYLVSSPIIDYYYTQIIGNPNCMPVIKASSAWPSTARWVVDADVYQAGGVLGYGATNVFWRQMRNFVIDLTSIPPTTLVAAIHWPTAQATSLQNILFKMSEASGTQHQGVFCESGSGGFMTDLVFYGGLDGVLFANQQFTMRNFTFYNALTAINMQFDWGWTFTGIKINNCTIGIDMTSLSVGSLTIIDSVFTNTPVGGVGIATSKTTTSTPPTANSLIIENVQFNNVPVAVSGASSTTLLAGTTGSITVAAFGQGHAYTTQDSGPYNLEGSFTPFSRSSSLTAGTDYYYRSKPQYAQYPVSSFVSVRTAGAKGDGVTDDTVALNAVFASAAAAGQIVYIDAGDYLVSDTIYIPPGSRITGETYPVILASGPLFEDINSPLPVVQVGKKGDTGTIEWSDTIISTKGAQAGAILIEVNIAATGMPAGLWDVHTRIGGFTGSDLQLAECPTTNLTTITATNFPTQCIAAFLSMHVTAASTGLYIENSWLWTADHDVDDPELTQISIYSGRGLLIESTQGKIWLYGTAVEHHSLYQYQLANTDNIFMGFIQTETPYYQPNPDATYPFSPVIAYSDPIFTAGESAWGLRIVSSESVWVYGAGLYSFFDNYDVICSNQGNGETCQKRIFSIEESIVQVYNLNTVGTTVMITQNGNDVANYADNLDGFVDTIAYYS